MNFTIVTCSPYPPKVNVGVVHLFQYEQFFAKHREPQVRKYGGRLIALIDQLEATLLVTSSWSDWPPVKGQTRIEQIKMLAILHSIDRFEGNRTAAAKWLGISRYTIYKIIGRWNKQPIPKHETKPIDLVTSSLAVNTNSLSNRPNGPASR